MTLSAFQHEEMAENILQAANQVLANHLEGIERAELQGIELSFKAAHVHAMLAVAKRTAEQSALIHENEQYRRSH